MDYSKLKERWRLTSIVVILLGLGMWQVFAQANNVGYSPVQPLPFSHRLHAGQYHIPCQYCHAGVNRSHVAPIPALNVCMGCHSVIATNTEPIKKLTTYWNDKKPVQWVRMYQLPQFVRFDHRWHIAAGIQCQTCHGPIQSMNQVRQVKQFTMGQCLDCHRNTNYLPPKGKQQHWVTAYYHGHQVNAPTECSTCHY